MQVKDVGDAVLYVGAICAALAAIGAVVAVVGRWAVLGPLKRWQERNLVQMLAETHAQVTPNGGSSMRDAVTRIERRLADHIANDHGK